MRTQPATSSPVVGAHSPVAPVAARATSRRHFDRIPRPRWEHRPGPHPSRRLIRSPLYIPTAYNRIYSQPARICVQAGTRRSKSPTCQRFAWACRGMSSYMASFASTTLPQRYSTLVRTTVTTCRDDRRCHGGVARPSSAACGCAAGYFSWQRGSVCSCSREWRCRARASCAA